MLLTIDIGNTTITLGLYKSKKLEHRWRLVTDHYRLSDEYGLQILGLINHAKCPLNNIEGVCLASVVPPLTGQIITACKQYLHQTPLIIDHTIKTGITILYNPPQAVGADRIVDTVAVKELYGGPACVVDFGTATTFNAINASSEYLGGAITPGIGISTDALFHRTAKLPRVDLKQPPSVIGTNTTHAIQSGLLFGYTSLVEGMISRFQKELGNEMKVIATGGYSELIANLTDSIDIINPWLTLEGLRILWEMNK